MQVLANTTIIMVKNSTTYELLIISCFNTSSSSFKSSCLIADCGESVHVYWTDVIVCPLCCEKETKADLRNSLSSPDTAVSIVIQTPVGEAKYQTGSAGSLYCAGVLPAWAD